MWPATQTSTCRQRSSLRQRKIVGRNPRSVQQGKNRLARELEYQQLKNTMKATLQQQSEMKQPKTQAIRPSFFEQQHVLQQQLQQLELEQDQQLQKMCIEKQQQMRAKYWNEIVALHLHLSALSVSPPSVNILPGLQDHAQSVLIDVNRVVRSKANIIFTKRFYKLFFRLSESQMNKQLSLCRSYRQWKTTLLISFNRLLKI